METGCSGLHYITYRFIKYYYPHPLHPPPTAPPCNEYPVSRTVHVRVLLSFQQPTSQKETQHSNDCSAAYVVMFFGPSELLKRRLLKWFLEHPMNSVLRTHGTRQEHLRFA